MMNQLKKIYQFFVEGILSFFFPNLCVGCLVELIVKPQQMCLVCQFKSKKTEMHMAKENEFTQRLEGKIPLKTAAAMFYFNKGTPIQNVIHQLKYKSKPEIGVKLGLEYGHELMKSPDFRKIDVIIPVPLHPKRERERGYNQSTQFAIGLSESMQIPYQHDGLVRVVHAISQTKKKRSARFRKTNTYFAVKDPALLTGKRVLLVDDVLTSGATMIACGNLLAEVPDLKLYMATIAIAVRQNRIPEA
jgi:ComF family protein